MRVKRRNRLSERGDSRAFDQRERNLPLVRERRQIRPDFRLDENDPDRPNERESARA